MSKRKCNGTIGVVDDRSGIRDMLKEYLEMKDFIVHTGEDGYQAIELVENNAIDLLLLDLSMPNMDGLEAEKKIREIKPDQKIIFLTGHDEETFAEKMGGTGDYDYLSKPFDLLEMVKKVRVSVGLPEEEEIEEAI